MNIIYILKEKQQEETHTQQNNECTTNMCILEEYCTKEKKRSIQQRSRTRTANSMR